MRILIIGGTGFIGAHVIRQLVGQGHTVTVFHRGRTEADLPEEVYHINGERQDMAAFISAFKQLSPQVVLDMVLYTERDAQALMETFEALAQRMVIISSADVYSAYDRFRRVESGPQAVAPLTEDAPLRRQFHPYRALAQGPDDWMYDYDKILVERVVMSDPHLPATVLRLAAVYGPGDHQHRPFEYLKRMDDGRRVILLGEEQSGWSWTRGYVENVAAAIALAVTDERATGRIYNVGQQHALTEPEWVRCIGRAAGWQGEVLTLPSSVLPNHLKTDYNWDHNLVVDSSRIRQELGFNEHIPLQQALEQTVAWERASPPKQVDRSKFDYAAEDAVVGELESQN